MAGLMRLLRVAVLALLTPFCVAQRPSPAGSLTQEPAKTYAAQREIALAPVFELMSQGNYAAALTTIRPIVTAYPHDVRVLFLAADAALVSRHFEDALAFTEQSIDQSPAPLGVSHLGFVRTYADLGRWEDFNRERAIVRRMALDGDRTLSVKRGYVIEDHRAGNLHIEVLSFHPSTAPPSHREDTGQEQKQVR